MLSVGISCFYHDSAVAFIDKKEILFALAEERLSRIKHDKAFPQLAFFNGLQALNVNTNDIDVLTYYEDPELKLLRLIDFIVNCWPHTKNTFFKILPNFFHNNYPIKKIISDQLQYPLGKIHLAKHHWCHAASSFFTSSFEKALIVTIDGVGEQETLCVFSGTGNELKLIKAVHFPDSLGLLYSIFTNYLGFKPNSGEYKVMGLAPYGTPEFEDLILKEIIQLGDDGYPKLNMRFFDFDNEARHFTQAFEQLFGEPARFPESPITTFHKNIAASIQAVLEKALFKILYSVQKETKAENLCLSGGVALNCSFNGKLLERGLFKGIHIHNACGDDAGALGAAIAGILPHAGKQVIRYSNHYSPYLGTEYSNAAIMQTLKINKIPFQELHNSPQVIAAALANGKVVSIFQGRDEWGPRSLGNRSILADPRTLEMKDTLNAKIKFREEFRPFAPVCLEEETHNWFDVPKGRRLPDMLFTCKVKKPEHLGAVTHVNNTARLQTLDKSTNPFLHDILKEFQKITGVPVLVNTSFNLRGEPIVCSPFDALNSFNNSHMDMLVFNKNIAVKKNDAE